MTCNSVGELLLSLQKARNLEEARGLWSESEVECSQTLYEGVLATASAENWLGVLFDRGSCAPAYYQQTLELLLSLGGPSILEREVCN